jgi:hypothetical protein
MIEDRIEKLEEIVQKLCPHKEVYKTSNYVNGMGELFCCHVCGEERWTNKGERKWFGRITKEETQDN